VVALTALSLLPVLALAASEKRTRSVDYARSSG
jgi:hypothetical protein